MPDYQANSKGQPEGAQPNNQRPEVKKIVTGEVVMAKKSLGDKFIDTFFDGEFFKGLIHHVYRDVIVPNAKHILFDTGLEILKGGIYRNGNARQILNPQSLVSRFTYQTPVNNSSVYPATGYPSQPPMTQIGPAGAPIGPRPQMLTHQGKRVYRIINRKDAEDTLSGMSDIINSEYKVVSVAEVHEMLGLEHTPVDVSWGWYAIGDAEIRADRDGYLLVLPQPESL